MSKNTLQDRAARYRRRTLLSGFGSVLRDPRSEDVRKRERARELDAYMRHLASDPFRAPRPEPVSLLYDRPRAELHIRDRCGALVAVIGDHGIQSADEWKAMVDDERSDRDLANTYVIAHPQPPQICERSAEEERILALAGCADDSADDEASDADA